jgi:hypothetical protein
MFFSITPLPLRTGAILRPIERRSLAGMSRQLSMPSRLREEVAKESMELLGTALAQRAASQRFENRFALRAPDWRHDAAVLVLITCHKIADRSRDMPAVKEPERLGKLRFTHPLKSFVAVA